MNATLANVAMPAGIAALPRNHVGYPIPYFVATLKDGTRDFRVAGVEQQLDAIRFGLCWICGRKRGRYGSFVIGSMCAVNRVSAEPPSHHECATYAALICPFLATPNMRRRETGLPDDRIEPAGTMLLRNPGVSVVWTSRRWRLVRDSVGGRLWDIGDPVSTEWYTSGRPATWAEAMDSINTGLPAVREVAEKEGPAAVEDLKRQLADALTRLPDNAFYEPDEPLAKIREITQRPADFVTGPPQ